MRASCQKRIGWTARGAICVGILAFMAFPLRLEAKIVDRIVAFVNAEALTQGDLQGLIRDHAQILQAFQRLSPAEAQSAAEEHSEAHLEELIATSLLVQEARRQEQENPQYQIAQTALDDFIRAFRIERELTDDAEFVQALRQRNQTQEMFRREMLRTLRIRELLTRELIPRLNVTHNDAEAYYEANKEAFASKDEARRALREKRFLEERKTYIARLRQKAFVKVLIQF